MSSSPALDYPVVSLVAKIAPRTVVDVGAGYGRWSFLITRHYKMNERPLTVGVEIYTPYTRELKSICDHVVRASATALPLRPGYFQLAVCCEVLEHLERSMGEIVLKELELVANSVIVSVPEKPSEQEAYNGNPCQVHRTRWRRNDFTERGWKVRFIRERISRQINRRFILTWRTKV